jgi:NodT family efflux transporter outer membrane factor (OMF) lipoprotein
VQASQNQGTSALFGASAGAALAPSGILTPVSGTSGTTTTPNNPNVSGGIGGATSGAASSAGFGRFFSNNATNLNASWEIDIWGLFRRNLEAANSSLEQSIANHDEIVVMLLANVATQYIQIRTFQKRLELARKNVALQTPFVDASFKRFKAGAANSEPNYYQLKSNLDNTKALIPPLEAALRQANNQLCILLGIPVRDLLPELGDGTIPDPANPKQRNVKIPRPKSDDVIVGIPGDLLLRRPDVIAAERQLQIQSAQIGIAEAEMYPHMGINGSIGLAASSITQVFTKYSWTGSIGPSLTWNILNYGRLLGNVRLQNAQFQQFVAQYQNTVLTANQDAENAMIAYLRSLDQSARLQDSADAASRVTRYYVKQFEGGALFAGADTAAQYNQIFTTTNFQVTQQDAAAQAEGNVALNLILLYRSMGGGWQIRQTEGWQKPDCHPDESHGPATEPPPGLLPPPKMAPEPGFLPAPKLVPSPAMLPEARPVFGAPVSVEAPKK